MTDKRSAVRPRTHLKANIELYGGSVLPCIVRDLTPDGARLSVSGGVALPTSFPVTFVRSGRRFTARIRWRRDDDVGVTLEADAQIETRPDAQDSYTRKLEIENAKLRRLLDELRSDPSRLQELLEQAA